MIRTAKRRKLLAGGLVALAALVTAACSSSSAESAAESAHHMGTGEIAHIHGVSRDPGSGQVVIATHEGLFTQHEGGWQGGGQVIDLMGFVIAPDGTYLATGHPGPNVDLPEPAGLLQSTDRGQTWSSLSRGGESDFHALTAGPGFVVGFDGALRVTTDRTTWSDATIAAPPRSLAASPKSGTVLATTEKGLLATTDRGSTWATLTPPELLVVVAWADDRTIVGAGVDGKLHTSRDAGLTWTTGQTWIGQVGALSASVTDDGKVESLMVVGTKVLRSLDGGTTTEPLG